VCLNCVNLLVDWGLRVVRAIEVWIVVPLCTVTKFHLVNPVCTGVTEAPLWRWSVVGETDLLGQHLQHTHTHTHLDRSMSTPSAANSGHAPLAAPPAHPHPPAATGEKEESSFAKWKKRFGYTAQGMHGMAFSPVLSCPVVSCNCNCTRTCFTLLSDSPPRQRARRAKLQQRRVR
jgi:hypothetical protein